MNNPFHGINLQLFLRIAKWKLRGQYGRNRSRLQSLSEENVIAITETVVNIAPHVPQDCLLDVQMTLLMSLPGTGIGLASAFLTLYYPEKYGIIDFRTWEEINNVPVNVGRTSRIFSIRDYKNYITQIQQYANEKGISVQLVDFALWKIWELRRN